MINLFKNFFENQETKKNNDIDNNLELLCGLMIEAAYSDGLIEDKEIEKIKHILINSFNEKEDAVELKINQALENKNNSKSLYYYTSRINKEYNEEKKLLLLETLWEIILSDGEVHDYETSLIRRLSGLLYISDINSGNARKRALNKITLKQ